MKTAWILSSTGRQVFLPPATRDEIDIQDIAHHLSLLCRFNGACRTFYSVAQHSLYVSQRVSPENRLWGLLHDAAEAYIGDWVRPVKHDYSPALRRSIQELESGVLRVIAWKFGLSWPMPQEVQDVDDRMLATEMRDLMPRPPAPICTDQVTPFAGRIEAEESWRHIEKKFLVRFRQLAAAGRE